MDPEEQGPASHDFEAGSVLHQIGCLPLTVAAAGESAGCAIEIVDVFGRVTRGRTDVELVGVPQTGGVVRRSADIPPGVVAAILDGGGVGRGARSALIATSPHHATHLDIDGVRLARGSVHSESFVHIDAAGGTGRALAVRPAVVAPRIEVALA